MWNSTPSTNAGESAAFSTDWEVMVINPQKGQLWGRNWVYLSMDSPHGNYPLLNASSVGVICSAHRRKLVNDSVYFLQYQSPFKGDAMTVGEISCCVQVLLVMYGNFNQGLSFFPILLLRNQYTCFMFSAFYYLCRSFIFFSKKLEIVKMYCTRVYFILEFK